MRRRLRLHRETLRLQRDFTISRGRVAEVEVVLVELEAEGLRGRGECRPYPRYGETAEGVMALVEGVRDELEAGCGRADVPLPAGAARNAVDCALWDLEAKLKGKPAWHLAGLSEPQPLTTAFTLSLDGPVAMAEAARAAAARPLLKLKLDGTDDLERVAAVRAAAPAAGLIVDANEAWSVEQCAAWLPAMAELGVALVEQPLPAGQDEALGGLPHSVPLCADESCHDTDSLRALVGRYEVVNLKLDKTGGLTEGLRCAVEAERLGLQVMVGCMVGSSLAMAPAVLLAQGAAFVDLDGPLMLARDREPGLRFEGSILFPPRPELWG